MTTKLQIVKKKARELGYNNVRVSTRKDKKYMIQVINEETKEKNWVHFGAKNYKDFLDHKNEKLRKLYRKRHQGVRLKDNSPAYMKRGSPAFFSYYILW